MLLEYILIPGASNRIGKRGARNGCSNASLGVIRRPNATQLEERKRGLFTFFLVTSVSVYGERKSSHCNLDVDASFLQGNLQVKDY
eukprot:m.78650 g.78650  ORF g.78650 m.78650 type:complete len:86 (-) comp8582_c1_seq5:1329-1586(-)